MLTPPDADLFAGTERFPAWRCCLTMKLCLQRCAARRPSGTPDPQWVLSCRLGQSRARPLAVWDDLLSGTSTDLADPRSIGR